MTETDRWAYEPGMLELLDAGSAIEDMPPGPVERVTSTRGPGGVERLVDWLQGFRFDAVVCEGVATWLPIVEVWPAPGGSAEFTYELAASRAAGAEIRVFASGGLGGSCGVTFASAIHWPDSDDARSLQTIVFVTARRYVHRRTGEHLDRIDVSGSAGRDTGEQAAAEYRHATLDVATHPIPHRRASKPEITAAKFVVTGIQRCRDLTGATEHVVQQSQLRSWSFGADLGLPALPAVKLQASMSHAESFTTRFTLPGGDDYAFCARVGESPVSPLCVALEP